MTSDEIFQSVFEAMQPAEELGGRSGNEYIQLMVRISEEATKRSSNYLASLQEPATIG